MANNLSEFISLIKRNSIARTNRFRINFALPASLIMPPTAELSEKVLSLTCLITDIPSMTEQTTSISYGNYDRKIVNGRSMGDFNTTFLVTGKYQEKIVFDAWHNLINDEDNRAVEYYDNYVTTVTVDCLNENDDVVYQFELTEAYPLHIGQLKLDRTAQNQQMVLDVSWAYHKFNTIIDMNMTQTINIPNIPPIGIPGPEAGKQRLFPIPGIDQMSAAVQSAAAMGTEFRNQLQGVLAIANDVREQVRDFKMEAINGVKILNGVVKDVKAINNIPTDVKNEVIAVVTDTKNQIGYLKDDIKNISNYPKR